MTSCPAMLLRPIPAGRARRGGRPWRGLPGGAPTWARQRPRCGWRWVHAGAHRGPADRRRPRGARDRPWRPAPPGDVRGYVRASRLRGRSLGAGRPGATASHGGRCSSWGADLTAVDVALSLRDVGHAGTIRMVSSHGLLPEAHVREPLPTVPPCVTVGSPAAASVRRRDGGRPIAATRDAADWRQVVDGLRPQTVPLWRGLSETEQRRFLRHVARRWEVRRHRMAPEVAAAIAALRSAGCARHRAGTRARR